MSKSPTTFKIKFVGGKSGESAPSFLTDGNTRIVLPTDQSKPFAHASAKRILRVAPELYKRVGVRGSIARRVRRSAETGKFVSPQFAAEHPATTVTETV